MELELILTELWSFELSRFTSNLVKLIKFELSRFRQIFAS